MLFDGVRVIAPSCYPEDEWSEAEVLGGLMWLWNQHAYYRQGSVESAMEILTSIIASRNFCFFVKDQQPLGYVNWAFLSPQDEQAYIHKTAPYASFINRQHPGAAMDAVMVFPCGREPRGQAPAKKACAQRPAGAFSVPQVCARGGDHKVLLRLERGRLTLGRNHLMACLART